MALECNRQQRFTEDIAQRRAVLEKAFLHPVQGG
jgi:hypothetical protein